MKVTWQMLRRWTDPPPVPSCEIYWLWYEFYKRNNERSPCRAECVCEILAGPDLDALLSAGNALNFKGRRWLSTFSKVYGPRRSRKCLPCALPTKNLVGTSDSSVPLPQWWLCGGASWPAAFFPTFFFCPCCSVQSAADRATGSTHLLTCRHRSQRTIMLLPCHAMLWRDQQEAQRAGVMVEREMEEMAKGLMNDRDSCLSGRGSEGGAGEESGRRGWSSQLQMKKTLKHYLGIKCFHS